MAGSWTNTVVAIGTVVAAAAAVAGVALQFNQAQRTSTVAEKPDVSVTEARAQTAPSHDASRASEPVIQPKEDQTTDTSPLSDESPAAISTVPPRHIETPAVADIPAAPDRLVEVRTNNAPPGSQVVLSIMFVDQLGGLKGCRPDLCIFLDAAFDTVRKNEKVGSLSGVIMTAVSNGDGIAHFAIPDSFRVGGATLNVDGGDLRVGVARGTRPNQIRTHVTDPRERTVVVLAAPDY